MKLLTQEIEKNIPKLYATEQTPKEQKKVWIKLFTPWGDWTWFGVEGERQEDGDFLFFGIFQGRGETEWTYFSLAELESITGPYRLKVERDMNFKPKALAELPAVVKEVA